MVLAVRGYNRPIVRPYAGAIVPDVHQIHSVDDRHPSQLPDGGTLIVGTGLSGVQIMEDLHFTGRPVHVAVGPAPRSPRK